MWSHKIKTKSYFIFQEVQKKMPAAMPVATTDYCGSTCCRLTVCYLTLRCTMSVWKNIHVLLMWKFGTVEFLILLLSLSLLCTHQRYVVSQAEWAVFWQLFPWALFCWQSFFWVSFSTLVLHCSKHIRGVGRHVGITFCAKDPASGVLEKSLAADTKMQFNKIYINSFWHPHFKSVDPKLIMIA